MNFNRLTDKRGGVVFHAEAPTARYLIERHRGDELFTIFRVTGLTEDWAAEPLGTALFLDTAEEICDERERREAEASAAAEPRRVDQARVGGA